MIRIKALAALAARIVVWAGASAPAKAAGSGAAVQVADSDKKRDAHKEECARDKDDNEDQARQESGP